MKNISQWMSMGRMTSPILWKIKNVWNHQPDISCGLICPVLPSLPTWIDTTYTTTVDGPAKSDKPPISDGWSMLKPQQNNGRNHQTLSIMGCKKHRFQLVMKGFRWPIHNVSTYHGKTQILGGHLGVHPHTRYQRYQNKFSLPDIKKTKRNPGVMCCI